MNISKLVNFTEENLSKIHVSQLTQLLDNYHIKYNKKIVQVDTRITPKIWVKLSDVKGKSFIFDNKNYHLLPILGSMTLNLWTYLIRIIYPIFDDGNLTDLHQQFTEIYNEIMSYEVQDE